MPGRRPPRRIVLVLGLAAVLAATGTAIAVAATRSVAPIPVQGLRPAQRVNQPIGAGVCGQRATQHPVRVGHVVWIWMENHSYSGIIGSPDAPYLNSLAAQCGLTTNYRAITHPSLPNYLAATSGLGLADVRRFSSDCVPTGSCVLPGSGMF